MRVFQKARYIPSKKHCENRAPTSRRGAFFGGTCVKILSQEPCTAVRPLQTCIRCITIWKFFYTCRAGPAPQAPGKAPVRLARILLIFVGCSPLSDQGETIVQFPRLVCPIHRLPLTPAHPPDTSLVCPHGCRFPVRDGLARFVPAHNYAARFGRQWRRFRTTQLDSHTGTTISRDRLTRMAAKLSGRRPETYADGLKRILLDVAKPFLPADFATRRKRGFGMPFGSWLRGPLRAVFDDALSPAGVRAGGLLDPGAVAAVKADFEAGRIQWMKPWLLLVFELWRRDVLRDGGRP